VRPYLRAATNPDPDSWVREFIDWWIGEDGYPIAKRSGVLRYFVRIDDAIEWGASKRELIERFPKEKFRPDDILSVTFIAATIEDNPALLSKDPSYLAKLKALPRIEKARLLGGNWNSKATAGKVFARTDFDIVPAVPEGGVQRIRSWDLASTPGGGDWTVGLLICRAANRRFYIEDVVRVQQSEHNVRKIMKNVASADGKDTTIRIPQDPGQAGKWQAKDIARDLAGYAVIFRPVTGKKYNRARPLSAQAQAGNVSLVEGPWNKPFLNEAENFTGEEGGVDDQIDAAADGYNELCAMQQSEPRIRQL
jgi:predicted phage terminase large subunit-like protein